MPLLNLFLTFVKIGAILLGGGYVILPILMNEFTEKKQLLDKDDLLNYFTISQSLPGIIAVNISIFIGYKLKGKVGAILAMLGVVFVPFFTIVILASVLAQLTSNQYVQWGLWGISIGVIVMIFLTIREIWDNAKKDWYYYLIFLSSLIFIQLFQLSPIKTILIFITLGLIINRFLIKKEAK